MKMGDHGPWVSILHDKTEFLWFRVCVVCVLYDGRDPVGWPAELRACTLM